jgi:hypothetical protein
MFRSAERGEASADAGSSRARQRCPRLADCEIARLIVWLSARSMSDGCGDRA